MKAALVLGVTGSIASGKSQVAREFERLGAALVDADQLAREVVAPGSAVLERLVDVFGTSVKTDEGQLDRAALGKMIFADVAARKLLNSIIHPAIAELAQRRLEQLRQRQDLPLIVYEAALLFEAGAADRVDQVLVVKIDPEIQLRRLMARDQCDAATARQKLAAQLPQEEQLARADHVIDNSGSPDVTRRQVARLWEQLVACPTTD